MSRIKPLLISIVLLPVLTALFFGWPSFSWNGEQVKICFGVAAGHLSEASRKDTKSAFEMWLRKLSQKKGRPVQSEVIYYTSLGDVDRGIARGEINCIALTPIEYLSLKNKNLVMPALSYCKENSPYETYLLMVHRESPCKSIRDLRKKRIIVEQGKKVGMPLYWLDTVLLEADILNSARYFGSLKQEDNAMKIAVPLYFRQTDACVISRSAFKMIAEMNPRCGNDLRVLTESEPIVQNLVCFSRTFPEREKEDFISIGSNLTSDIEGRQILMLFQLDALIPFKEEHLKSAEELKRIHDSLAQKNRAAR